MGKQQLVLEKLNVEVWWNETVSNTLREMTIWQNIGANHNESQKKIPLLIFKKIITSLASLLQAQFFVHCFLFFILFLIMAISSFYICIESIGGGIMFAVSGRGKPLVWVSLLHGTFVRYSREQNQRSPRQCHVQASPEAAGKAANTHVLI